jgi:hypothetical protein
VEGYVALRFFDLALYGGEEFQVPTASPSPGYQLNRLGEPQNSLDALEKRQQKKQGMSCSAVNEALTSPLSNPQPSDREALPYISCDGSN